MTTGEPDARPGQGATPPQVRLLSCGDTALSVEFGSVIDAAHNARVLALDAALKEEQFPGLRETVPTYRSLMVIFDPLEVDLPALKARITELTTADVPGQRKRRLWRVPVVYGGEYGVDLDATASHHGISAGELVRRHMAGTYSVAMLGFMPGFAYLDGLDPGLATPRRLEPRQVTPAQSVSVGGAQGAISTVEGPSGWHLLGRTPARGFMQGREPMFLYEPGDEIRFESIGLAEWAGLDARAAEGEPIAIRQR